MSKVVKSETVKKGLDLVPNEVIGYRIAPEPHNWTVSIVKKKGDGTEYKTPVTYHKHLGGAVSWIYNTVALTEGKALQNDSQTNDGVAADPKVLLEAFNRGLLAALKAADSLEDDLVAMGYQRKNLSTEIYEKLTGTSVNSAEEDTSE